jgi:hypothetical protein
MPTYLLSVFGDESKVEEMMAKPELMAEMYASVGAYNEKLMESGAWVFAGGLKLTATATVARPDGSISAGSYLTAPEPMGGFWVIKADDDDAALEWAKQGSAACGSPVEVRPFQDDVDG